MEAKSVEYRTVFFSFLIIILQVLKNGDKVLAQSINVTYQINQDEHFGPVVEIDCSSELLTDTTIRWVYQGRTLAENGVLHESIGERYAMSRAGQSLLIRNIVKADEGEYFCQILDRTNGMTLMSSSVHVQIRTYLPEKSSLRCGIYPNLLVMNGSRVAPNCTIGESSNAGVKLKLFWKREGAPLERIFTLARKRVVLEDQGAIFVCKMRSTVFPSVRNECTAGPIRFNQPTPTMPSNLRTRRKILRTTKPSPPETDNTGMLLGVVFGSIFLFIFIIVVIKGIESEKDVYWIQKIKEATASSSSDEQNNTYDFLDAFYEKREGNI